MTATAMTGKLIALEYSFRTEDNQLLNSNVGKPPLTYTQGAKEVISVVESAVEGMMVGETKHVVVPPVDGFGPRDPDAIQEVHKHKLPKDITVGTRLRLQDTSGQDLRPTVLQVKDHTALLDFNHPLAGNTRQYVVHRFESGRHRVMTGRVSHLAQAGGLGELSARCCPGTTQVWERIRNIQKGGPS